MQRTHRILLVAAATATLGLMACPSPKVPLGPPPEYEDPPLPQAAPLAPAPSPAPDAGSPGDG